MSSTEEYLDSLLRSVMSGKKPPEPINQIINESPAEPVSEPVMEAVAEPVVEPVMEPIAEPVVEPVMEAVAEPVVEPAMEPIAEPVVEPVIEPAVEYADAPIEEPIIEQTVEPEEEITPVTESPREHVSFIGSILSEIPSELTPEEEPISDMPIMDEPIADMPIADMPISDMPISDDLISDMPITDEPIADMPIMDEPIADMPIMDEPIADMPISDDLISDMPIMDEPTSDEPVADEDISNLLKSIEEMGSPEVADETPEVTADEPVEAAAAEMFEEIPISMGDDSIEEAPASEDEIELGDLLSGMEGDSELGEIGDLLSMADNNEVVDESVLEQTQDIDFNADSEDLFNIDEPLGEDALEEGEGKKKPKKEKKKKEKKKKEKKDKKDNDEAIEGLEQPEGESSDGKKPGFFSKIMDSLTREVEEEEEVKQIFEETAVDIAVETAAENQKIMDEYGDDEEEAPQDKKGKKGKKEKKPKEKKKKVKKEVFPDDPSLYKKLPLKNVIVICILCFSLGIVITLLTYLYPYYRDTRKAQSAYDHGNYTEAYTDLKGHNLNKKQQELYNKSVVILKEKRKIDSYEKYMKLNMPAQALDALLQGLRNSIDFAAMAEELGIMEQFNEFRLEIEDKITSTFGLELETAYDWCMIDDAQEYSRNIYNYLDNKGMMSGGNVAPINNSVISGEEEEFSE